MDPLPLKFMVEAAGGELLCGSGETFVCRVCTDSRKAQPGDVFFALPGERFDGHQYIEEAGRRGASALVIQRDRLWPDLPNCSVVGVDDTRRALGRFAEAWRREIALPMIAVGGSNGKTTTKELVAAVLRQSMPVLWSEASFNNDVGVPLTLLRLDRTHRAAVLEVGTNHPGELEPLVRMVQPRYGIITSIGREHLEHFGDLAGVAREEGWLAELLPAEGRLFIAGDSDWTDPICERTRATVIRAGCGERNDYRLRSSRLDKQGVTFRVEAPAAGISGEYRINLLGRHQASNALFAIALGAEFGLTREEIQRGLSECQPAKMRMQFWEQNGVRVLDDSYNANADSMLAALRTLQELPCRGRRVAVLGDMAELGAHTEAAHEEVGRHAAELGVGQLFAVGKMAPVLARGARNAGLHRIFEFPDVESAAVAVRSFVRVGDILLLKASRVTRLERVAELLRAGDVGKKN